MKLIYTLALCAPFTFGLSACAKADTNKQPFSLADTNAVIDVARQP